jgi:hypothetical protein
MTISITSYDITSDSTVVTAPDVTDLTSGKIDGTGVFDILMQVAKAHLATEYNQQRITGKDYANVYLGAMTAVMQQAVTFALGYQQSELLAAQIGLIRQQTVTELSKTSDDLISGIGFNSSSTLGGSGKAELLLIQQKAQTELAQTSSTLSPSFGLSGDTTTIGGAVGAQITKTATESALLTQKTVTELAQVSDAAATGGMIKKQRDLYTAQTNGYARDAEQKAAKMMLETWSIRRTTDDGTDATPAGVGDSSILTVVNKLKTGIGL